MSENFDKVRTIRNPRFSSSQESYSSSIPPIQYVSGKRENSLPIVTLVLSIMLICYAAFQQFQIMQLTGQARHQQSEMLSLRSDLNLTNQKAEAALIAIKETQDKERVCRVAGIFPVVGDWLCAISELHNGDK